MTVTMLLFHFYSTLTVTVYVFIQFLQYNYSNYVFV